VLAIVGLALTEVLTTSALVSDWWLNTKYPDWEEGLSDDATVASLVYGFFALQAFVATVFCVVTFLMFVHRASQNAFALRGPVVPNVSPGWSVASWFIPFANLVWPYKIMKTLLWASDPAGESIPGDRVERARWTFPLWWFTWLISSFAGNASLRLTMSDDPSAAEMARTIDFVSLPFSLVCAVCAAAIVWSLHVRQEAQFSRNQRVAPAPGAFALAGSPQF
jgi:hypothetical protein